MDSSLQESSNVSLTEPGDRQTGGRGREKGGKKRNRVKGLVKRLQEQIEFYFGDANLRNDKFLQQKISEHEEGYVSVDVIASFKRMKALTVDRALVVQAMMDSSLVQVSEDGLWVRRSDPLPEVTEVELNERILYVENLPLKSCNHDFVSKLFRTFGTVAYISLPRHKSTGGPKGYAFIEFSEQAEARQALEYFINKDKLPQTLKKRKPSVALGAARSARPDGSEVESGGTRPDGSELESGGTRPDGSEVESGSARPDGSEVESGGTRPDGSKAESGGARPDGSEAVAAEGTGVKRKRDDSTQEEVVESGKDLSEPAAKKSRRDSTKEASTSLEDGGGAWSEGGRRGGGEGGEAHGKGGSSEDGAEMSMRGGGLGGASRKRKREEEAHGREELGPTKSARLDSQSSECEGGEGGEGGGGGGGKKKKNRHHRKKDWAAILKELNLRVMSKKEWLEMKRMYQAMEKDHMRRLKQGEEGVAAGGEGEEGGRGQQTQRLRGFVANSLVQVKCRGDDVDLEKLKEVCAGYGEVAYVDMEPGSKEGLVRYREPGCVEGLVAAEAGSTLFTFTAVEEPEERAYYLKTQASRKQQQQRSAATNLKQGWRRRNTRGMDKVIDRALKRYEYKKQVIQSDPETASLDSQTELQADPSHHIRFSE